MRVFYFGARGRGSGTLWRILAVRMHKFVSIGLPYVAALVAGLGIMFPFLWILAPLGLALFFFCLIQAKTWKSAFFEGLVFGIATGGSGIWWFWDTLPLDWLGLTSSQVGFALVFLSWGPVTLMFGLVTAVGALLIWKMRHMPLAALLFAILWVLIEQARMWGFAILTYADRGFMGPHFSSTSIGYPLAESSYLLQIASFGGVLALNFATALFAAVLAFLAIRDRSVRLVPAIPVLLIVLSMPLFAPQAQATGESFTAVLGYSNIPVGTRDPENRFIEMLSEAATTSPEALLYVLPEERGYNPPFQSDEEKRALYRKLFGTRDVVVLSTTHVPAEPTGFNIALRYENGAGDVLGTYSKRFFMPGGEYMPHAMLAVFSLAPDSALSRFINSLPTKAPPRTELMTVPVGGHHVGALVCSDFLSPELNSELALKYGADVIVNSANPGWFHESKTLYDKTLQISKVHAVRGRSYYLQSSNGAPSFAIDPYGKLIAESPTGTGLLPVTLF